MRGIVLFLAVLGFGVAFRMMGNGGFPIVFYVKAAILLFCGNITLYGISYLVSFQFSASKGAGIGVGIVGSLVAALMQTGAWRSGLVLCALGNIPALV